MGDKGDIEIYEDFKKIEVHEELISKIKEIRIDVTRRGNKLKEISRKIIDGETLTEEENELWKEKLKKLDESNELSRKGIEKIKKNSVERVFVPSYEVLKSKIHKAYKENEGVDLQIDEQSRINIKTLLLYFGKDNRFLDSPILNKSLDFGGKEKESIPSLEKGLLIVGGYGVSKTSSVKAIKKIFNEAYRFGYHKIKGNFKYYTANNVVEKFEVCTDEEALSMFWKDMLSGIILFDDLKTENHANRYGKRNLFKEILEKRNDLKLKTHLIINYDSNHNNDLLMAIAELGKLYGGRVFDRVFMDYNILEFKGKSMRR